MMMMFVPTTTFKLLRAAKSDFPDDSRLVFIGAAENYDPSFLSRTLLRQSRLSTAGLPSTWPSSCASCFVG